MKVDYAYCSNCGHEFLDTDIDFEIGLRDPTTQWLYCPDCKEMNIYEHSGNYEGENVEDE